MRARVNGVEHELDDGTSLATVLRRCGVPLSGVAVAVDGAVVPRGQWARTVLWDGVVVEVLTVVQGGAV
ncbi:MAG: sulfur carrier protein ThiS [Sciscionella sp.]